MNKSSRYLIAAMLTALPLGAAVASPISWVDWTTPSNTGVDGQLDVNGTAVGVSFTGNYSVAQTNGGTNYWTEGTPAPYTGSALVDNAPPNSDIIELNAGGLATVTFSQPIEDPLIALVSWNSNTVDFQGTPIEILSFGPGFWGTGTPILNATGDGFFGSGEVHGVIRLPGTFSSFSFTHTTENWHGFSVGVVGLGMGGGGGGNAPIPGVALLLGLGLAGMAGVRRYG
ncbi:MAG TPA: hypothetical protein ENJ21_00405 [Chromatiaceae bacterium]|nr:hypothetical protein [Chromatiaceae bacterium]